MNRDYRIDILRIIALFFVVFLHYWSFQGYYQEPFIGIKQFLLSLARNFSVICVPLFLIITGYLCVNKTLMKGYVFGIKKVYFIYLICSILIFFAEEVHHRGQVVIFDELLKILCFKGSGYGWYVEMYIGLFFIIPLLNICWKNLNHKYIIFAVAVLTIVPDSLNWLKAENGLIVFSDVYNKIFPEFWVRIYPVFYYFIGCCFSEKKINIGIINSVILIIFADLAISCVCYISAQNSVFVWGKWQEFSSIFVVIMSICFANIILHLDFKPTNNSTKKLMVVLSDCVYGAYLLSYLFDNAVYFLGESVIGLSPKILWTSFLYVPTILILSLFGAYVVLNVYKLIFVRLQERKG